MLLAVNHTVEIFNAYATHNDKRSPLYPSARPQNTAKTWKTPIWEQHVYDQNIPRYLLPDLFHCRNQEEHQAIEVSQETTKATGEQQKRIFPPTCRNNSSTEFQFSFLVSYTSVSSHSSFDSSTRGKLVKHLRRRETRKETLERRCLELGNKVSSPTLVER